MESLQPQRERIDESDGFQLYSRSLEIRFRIDRKMFTDNSARIKLKCIAKIKEMQTSHRESVVTIYVPSMDQLSNQKLINWRNAGKSFFLFKNVKGKDALNTFNKKYVLKFFIIYI